MAAYDSDSTTTPTPITDYSVDAVSTDGVGSQKETFWYNSDFSKWYGNYDKIAKIKIAINAWATWVVGKPWTADARVTAILESITGWREDTWQSILWNMLVIKKVNGDAFAEIIKNEETGDLINLKPLDPSSIVTVVGNDGLIIRYEQISKVKDKKNKVIPIDKMFHLSNDRVADNIHGQSIIESLVWNIEAQEEARRVHRKKVKNSGIIGIIEVDIQDTTKITTLKTPIKEGVEEGNFLLVPKDVLAVKPWDVKVDTAGTIAWLNYLDDEFYMMIGIPKVILGGSSETEGDKKMSYVSFEQVYMRAITELKADIWNQLAIRIEFDKPASITPALADNQIKNTSQVGFQPNDTTAGVGE